jgi:hypothetical protein
MLRSACRCSALVEPSVPTVLLFVLRCAQELKESIPAKIDPKSLGLDQRFLRCFDYYFV